MSHWSLDPSLIYVVVAAVLYYVGGVRGNAASVPFRRARAASDSVPREGVLRELAFTAGLLTIVVALCSPIDYYSEELFWVHMTQHLLLLTVAPPLILLGRPWPRMWRAVPRSIRTPVGRTLAQGAVTRPLRRLLRPLPVFVLFNATMLVWHTPLLYGLTLRHPLIHNLEHTLFFFTGLLFWAYIVDPGPLRGRLTWPERAAYAIGAMVVGWGLAVALVLDPTPLYSHYAGLASRPGRLTALEDQQMAGGMMWVLGSLSYTVAAIYCFTRWATTDQSLPSHEMGATT